MPELTKSAGLLAQPLGRHRLQALDGGILVPHVVADFGAGHGLAHLGGRQGQRVGAEIDEVVHGCLDLDVRRRWAARRPHSVYE